MLRNFVVPPSHQHPWFWLWKINGILSSTRTGNQVPVPPRCRQKIEKANIYMAPEINLAWQELNFDMHVSIITSSCIRECFNVMISWQNAFCITDRLCGESTGDRSHSQRSSDAGISYSLFMIPWRLCSTDNRYVGNCNVKTAVWHHGNDIPR